MKKFVLLIAAACMLGTAQAQDSLQTESWFKKNKVFQNLDVSITAGTTGIGIDVASKIGDYVQLRAGYDYMPRFTKSIYFPVEVGGEPAVKYDAQGNREETKFDRMSKLLTSLTGYTVDDEVEMVGKPTVNNFKLLVDVFPFTNKHWHVTAGFYWGPSQFAYAENSTRAMTSLLAVSEILVALPPKISVKITAPSWHWASVCFNFSASFSTEAAAVTENTAKPSSVGFPIIWDAVLNISWAKCPWVTKIIFTIV